MTVRDRRWGMMRTCLGSLAGVACLATGAVASEPAPATRIEAPQPDPSLPTRSIASFALESQKVRGGWVSLPDHFVAVHRGARVSGTYRICVNPSGKVYDVQMLASLGDADPAVVETVRGWMYKPQTANVCATKVFTFQIP